MSVIRRSTQCDALLGQFHEIIDKMTVPLPPAQEFNAINLGVLQESMTVTGAGTSHTVAAYSRVTQPGLRMHTQEARGGERFLPVQQMSDGSYGVDMQHPHDHATRTNRELAARRRRIAQLEAANGTESSSYNNNNNNRGANRGGRGGRGGRGFARGGKTPPVALRKKYVLGEHKVAYYSHFQRK
eukprot:PhM_4_TR15936/c0_g1_i1/m.220